MVMVHALSLLLSKCHTTGFQGEPHHIKQPVAGLSGSYFSGLLHPVILCNPHPLIGLLLPFYRRRN